MNIKKKQEGITAISIAALLGVAVFFLMLAFVLIPIYLENFKVSSHLSKLKADSSVASMSVSEIRNTLFRRFTIDDVSSVKKEDVTVEHIGNAVAITVDYEVRAPTIGNVDVVVFFTESVQVR